MATGAYPALAIRPPESPLDQYAKLQQIQGTQQEQQLRALQIQEQTRLLQDQDATTKAMASLTPDANGKINYDTLPNLIRQNGGSANAQIGATKNIFSMKKDASEIAKNDAATGLSNAETVAKKNDAIRGRILNVVQQTDPAAKQSQWDSEVTAEENAGTVPPGKVSHTYPGDAQATELANRFALGSQLVKESQEREKIGLDAWKPVGGQLINVINGQKIGGIDQSNIPLLNKALETRWKVLNPDKPVPDYFQIQQGPNAAADFARVDKLLEDTEKSTSTKAQQDTANAIRAQTFELARDKADMNPVVGTDKTGKTVMVPMGQAQQMKLQNPMKADSDMVNKALAARHWLNLANTQADPKAAPEDMGIMQLVDKLDAEGKLGPIASRWNEFMTGKIGAGDPEIAALRAKMGLSTTLLMQAHVGSRGSSQMLEHFEDLANQKKLDGPTLKAALGAEVNYVQDKAMDPNPPSYGAKPQAATPKATHRYNLATGQIEEIKP